MNPNPSDQFTYSDTLSPYDLVVTKLADGLYHWQVIDRKTGKVIRQAETEGQRAQVNALQYGLDALRDIRSSKP